tara:strand:+ start:234 stop:533 length:300 start_codon:yes stop_codon:yes gene_type:complete
MNDPDDRTVLTYEETARLSDEMLTLEAISNYQQLSATISNYLDRHYAEIEAVGRDSVEEWLRDGLVVGMWDDDPEEITDGLRIGFWNEKDFTFDLCEED